MKKSILVLLLSIMTCTAFAQGMIGTKDATNFDFYTNDVRRGRWTKEGPLVIGNTAVPLQPGNVSLYCHGSAIFAYPMFLFQNYSIRSSPYEFGSTYYDAGDFASITLCGDKPNSELGGDMYLNAFINNSGPRNIVMNDSGGFVLVGVDAGGLYMPHQYSHFQVQHTAYAHGYSANIDVVDDTYTVTNVNSTVVATVTTALDYTVTLPDNSTVDPGRIFIIKVLNTSSPSTGSIYLATTGGATIDGASSPITVNAGTVLQLQYDGTNYYRIN